MPLALSRCVTNVFALLRLLPSSDRDKDVEILALGHQSCLRVSASWCPRFDRHQPGDATRRAVMGNAGTSGRRLHTGSSPI